MVLCRAQTLGLQACAIHPLDLNSENIPFPESGLRFTSSGIQSHVAMVGGMEWSGMEWNGVVGADLASAAVGARLGWSAAC